MFAFAGRSRQAGIAAQRPAERRAASAREERPATAGLTARAPMQLRSIAPLSAGAGVVQRQVEHDGTAYKGNNTRPGWRIHAENKLAKQLNEEEGTSYTGQDVNFAKYKKDRGHGVAFEAIQGWIVTYLNSGGNLGFLVLQADARKLLAECGSDERQNVDTALETLKTAVAKNAAGDDSIVSAANSLLSLLNSVSENLTPTSKYVNTYASYNFHPDFVASPGGTHISATKHTKTMASLGHQKVNKVLRTPTKGDNVVGIRGNAPLGSMSPDTHTIFSAFPYESRKMKSANVKKRFATTNPYLSSSSTASSTPKPKINLTPGSTSASSSPGSTTSTSSTSSLAVSNSNNNNNNINIPSSVAVPMATSSSSSTFPSSSYSYPTSSSSSSSTYPTSSYSYPTSSSSSYSSHPSSSYGGGFSTMSAPSSMSSSSTSSSSSYYPTSSYPGSSYSGGFSSTSSSMGMGMGMGMAAPRRPTIPTWLWSRSWRTTSITSTD